MYRQKRSIVWQYFVKKSPTSATCLLCKRDYKSAHNTTNLHEHLKRKHFTILQANQNPNGEVAEMIDGDDTPATLTQEVRPVASTSNATDTSQNADVPTNTMQNRQINFRQLTLRTVANELPQSKILKLHNLAVAMVCKDLQTLSMVEDKGFIEFVRELEPRYQLPNRRTLGRTILPKVYANVKSRILENLKQTEHVSITTDIWTNLHTQSFLTITGHYFLHNKLHSNVLATSVLKENHTNEHISFKVQKTLTEFNIKEKIVAVVTDNAANMRSAVRRLGYLHLPCTAHTLNLVVNDSVTAIPEIASLLKTCRSLITHFKSSVTAADKLRDFQTQMGLNTLKLKQDIHTRWNSSLIMLERLLAVKIPLCATVASLMNCPTSPNAQQWKTIQDIIPLLKPIEYVSSELGGEKYVTASTIMPLITGLQNAIDKIKPQTIPGYALKCNIMNNLEIRFNYIHTNKIITISTIADPRFKTAVFRNNTDIQTATETVISELTPLITAETNSETRSVQAEETEQETEGFWDFHVHKVSHLTRRCSDSSPSASAASTMKQYLDMPYENIKSDPVTFWGIHGQTIPTLKKIFEKYLCVPATSVPSERIFSKAGQIMSDRRNRLSPKNLDYLIFLNCNME
ncbi:E3 SUMO-protein ligase ZBED1-like [Lasioglossum baleicum]|uniref:E3 SUMO-protein ligase ZBED1-like n=1 Tax=Lasioglossum baleicum TaxID=434251 RepID=UPI003FCD4D84